MATNVELRRLAIATPKDRERMLRNLGYNAARAGRPPDESHKDDPVYMTSYRRGIEARNG